MAHQKLTLREKRKRHIRKTLSGTAERPRLTVYRSNKYLYAQIIDDVAKHTLFAANTLQEESLGSNRAAAKWLGETIASRALQGKVESVVFDRNGYRYHGIVKEIADAARAGGLKF